MWLKYNLFCSVSDNGEICDRRTGKVWEGTLNSQGYRQTEIYVSENGNLRKKQFRVHQLVAQCFLPRVDAPGLVIDHINGIRTDNRAINLRWCSHTVNNNNRR
jgi:hypothetical protein